MTVESQAEAKRRAQQAETDWRWMIEAPAGRRILAELIVATGYMQPSFSENPLRMAHAEGRRLIGGMIYERVTRLADGANIPALLAEVMVTPDVRRRSKSRSDDDSSD